MLDDIQRATRIVFCVIVLGGAHIRAQTVPDSTETPAPPPVTLSGSLLFSAELYRMRSEPNDVVRPRRPSSLYRLVCSPTVTIGSDIELPFTFVLSSNQTNVTTPRANTQTLIGYLQNPMNTVSFHPRYGFAQLMLGSYVADYSELTTGRVQAFGVGARIAPSQFSLSAFTGSVQRAVEPDPAGGITGAYARRLDAAQFVVGNERSNRFSINYAHIRDDTASITATPQQLRAEEGTDLSLGLELRAGELVEVEAELAGSIFTRSLASAEIDDPSVELIGVVQDALYSTRADLAGDLSARIGQHDWSLTARGRYVGDGYRAAGYPYMPSDFLEFSLDPYLALDAADLRLYGSIGWRRDNLSDTRLETSSQIIGSITANAQPTDAIGLSAGYSNFGIRNRISEDTLTTELVSHSATLSPTISLTGESLNQTYSLMLAYDTFSEIYNRDILVVPAEEALTTTMSGTLSWMIGLASVPLNATASIGMLGYTRLDVATRTLTTTAGASYRLFGGSVIPSLRLAYASIDAGSGNPDSRITVRFDTRFRATRRITFLLNTTLTSYGYGASRPGVGYTEMYGRATVQTSL